MSNINRRGVLKSVGVLGVLLPNLPLWPSAALAQGINPVARANFVGLSQALTGIPSQSFDPLVSSDNTSMVESYYQVLQTVNETALERLLQRYETDSEAGRSDVEIAKAYLGNNAATFTTDSDGTFSRLTVLLWLYGIYYGATEVSLNPEAANGAVPPEFRTDYVISGRAYNNSWVWRIGQTHPMGLSRFGYASWGDAPPSLVDYGLGEARPLTRAFSNQRVGSQLEVPVRARPQR